MVPIVIDKNREFDEESFKEYFLELCNKHQTQNRALAFAFIVYDFQDHMTQNILENQKYWTSLDIISGKYLSVLYVNSKDEYYKKRQEEIAIENLLQSVEQSNKNNMSLLVPLQHPTPLDLANDYLKKNLKIKENIKTPYIIFFQIQNREIIDYFIIELKNEKIEEAFLELKGIIEDAVESIKSVKPDNYENYQEILNLIRNRVENGTIYSFFCRKVIKNIPISIVLDFIYYFSMKI